MQDPPQIPSATALIGRSLFLLVRLAFYSLIGLRIYQINHTKIAGVSRSDIRGISIFMVAFAVAIEVAVQGVRFVNTRRARKRERLMELAAAEQERSHDLQRAWAEEDLPVVSAGPLLLQSGERCVLAETAQVFAPVTEVHRTGGFGSVSVPMSHGMRARVGKFASHPVATTQLALVNQGPLYLTDLRIVVLGELQMSQLPLSDILTLDVHTDGVRIGMANGKPVSIKTGSAQLGIYLRRVLAEQRA